MKMYLLIRSTIPHVYELSLKTMYGDFASLTAYERRLTIQYIYMTHLGERRAVHGIAIAALLIGIMIGGLLVYAFCTDRQESVSHDMNGIMIGMMAGLESKEGAEFERAFLDEMIVHHEGAVAMAQMVLQKSQRPELLKLANEIIAAQTAEIGMMRNWKAQWFGADTSVHSNDNADSGSAVHGI